MSSTIVIKGAQPYDGRYPLDFDRELTTREWGWIKRLAGYLPMAVDDDAFGDPELVCALAVIAMRRAGRIQPAEVPGVYDRLADAPFGSTITLEGEDQEETEPDPTASSSSNGATSGIASPASSATSPSTPNPTGTPASGTSPSAPAISAT